VFNYLGLNTWTVRLYIIDFYVEILKIAHDKENIKPRESFFFGRKKLKIVIEIVLQLVLSVRIKKRKCWQSLIDCIYSKIHAVLNGHIYRSTIFYRKSTHHFFSFLKRSFTSLVAHNLYRLQTLASNLNAVIENTISVDSYLKSWSLDIF